MPVERRGQVIAAGSGQPATGGSSAALGRTSCLQPWWRGKLAGWSQAAAISNISVATPAITIDSRIRYPPIFDKRSINSNFRHRRTQGHQRCPERRFKKPTPNRTALAAWHRRQPGGLSIAALTHVTTNQITKWCEKKTCRRRGARQVFQHRFPPNLPPFRV